ncbi:MAG: thiamine pyrophosphate-dependent enzyme [Thermodesulfobacteriota bacterium]|nr:thiamine pyrophosphate-dependent enzyme [Thermodesulfobacteriota bacterium]
MPSLQQMAQREGAFAGGHRMCAGCPVPIFTKMLTRVTDGYEIVAGNATGCLEVASSIYPYSAWKIPWIHTAFENAGASMSGVETMYRALRKRGKITRPYKFIAIGGDGGTYDIGFQSLSGAMERGHDLVYICYDNGAYMNTGVQRSSATPPGANTTTTPAGKNSAGRRGSKKDLTRIMVAHNIPYVAQASIHDPVDLSDKLKKAIEVDGPAFINIHCPCIPGWKIGPDMAVELARLGVETNYWPLYEVVDGQYKINYTPEKRIPVSEWMFLQGRFKHLQKPENNYIVDAFQQEVDRNWGWLNKQAA